VDEARHGVKMNATRGGLACTPGSAAPFGKAEVREFGVDQWSGTHQQPQAFLLTTARSFPHPCADQAGLIEQTRFDFMNRPGMYVSIMLKPSALARSDQRSPARSAASNEWCGIDRDVAVFNFQSVVVSNSHKLLLSAI
jgi:hypothetical protein